MKGAVDAGITVVCPAGNESGRLAYPGAYPESLGVAAVTSMGTLADFSGFGQPVALAAPGVDITVPIGRSAYRNWTGTSFSCAIAAGVVALMLRAAPTLSPQRIREILCETATTLGSTFAPNGGLVNAYLAVQTAAQTLEPKSPSKDRKQTPKRRGKRDAHRGAPASGGRKR